MTAPATRWWRVEHRSGATSRIRARDHAAATARAEATARACRTQAVVVSVCLEESPAERVARRVKPHPPRCRCSPLLRRNPAPRPKHAR